MEAKVSRRQLLKAGVAVAALGPVISVPQTIPTLRERIKAIENIGPRLDLANGHDWTIVQLFEWDKETKSWQNIGFSAHRVYPEQELPCKSFTPTKSDNSLISGVKTS